MTTVPSQAQTEKRKAGVEQVLSALATPIKFYGQVVDQNGDPVPAADIGYSAADKFMASGSGYTGKSDANGMFSISGIKGVWLGVNVRKEGYYQIHNVSNGSFAYGMGSDGYLREPPTRNKPAMFVLQKMGVSEPLIQIAGRQYKVAKDGQPLEIDLKTGKQVQGGQGDIRFERWANDQAKNEKGRFDWRFNISIPEGGIIERKGQFDFEAPTEGYQLNAEIDMSASLGEKWKYTVEKSYFIKTRDGHYARIEATIYGGHNNSLVLESFLNPKPGSRNLEFDPKKVVKSP